MRFVVFSLISSILLYSGILLAGSPSSTTFQARIILPSGAALEASSVNFRFTILDSVGTCSLYIEDHLNVNMTGSDGIATFALGSRKKVYPAGAVSMVEVFNNSASSLTCQAGGTYSPGTTDRRQVVMQFNDGSGWQTIPQLAINSAFYSNYANRAENLGGYPMQDFVRTVALPICSAGEALKYDGTLITCTPTGGVSGVTSVTAAAPLVVGGANFNAGDFATESYGRGEWLFKFERLDRL